MASAVEEIIEFQIQVAQEWIEEVLGLEGHPRLQFVGYFAALNALYWLWAMVDERETLSPEERDTVTTALEQITEAKLPRELRKKMYGGLRNEVVLLQALVEKLGGELAARIVSQHDEYIRFLLVERKRPIHRMDKRSRTDAVGDPNEGKKYFGWLRDSNAEKKLKALASVLYLIRSNLVHGSKVASVEDTDLVGRSVPPLRSIAEASLEYTRRCRQA